MVLCLHATDALSWAGVSLARLVVPILVASLCRSRLVYSSPSLRLSRISGVVIPRTRLGGTLAASANVPIHNRLDSSYLAEINVGSQGFRVVLDTGSSDLWIVSTNCTQDDCSKVPRYEPSSSLVRTDLPFRLDYLMGIVSGDIAYETVALGQYRIRNQTIALANHTSDLNLASSGYSGIMGLSFPSEASITPSAGQTLLSNLLSTLDDVRKFFAIRLSKHDSQSFFTIGALEPSLNVTLSDFSFSPVLPRSGGIYDYWKLPLRALSVDNISLPFSPSKVPNSRLPVAVLDTGTTLILGPTMDVDRIWEAVRVARKNPAGQWFVQCNRAVIVRMCLGVGDNLTEYVLDPADVNWAGGGQERGWCLGGIQASDDVNSGDWLFGDAFLRNVYVTHHATQPPSIGLLGMTNLTAALEAFRADRGTDTSPPVNSINPYHAITTGDEHRSIPIYVASLVVGFLVGAGSMLLGMRSRTRSRWRNRA